MELPTYTSIWRIEKRLYKLYDFRLPMPLPVGQIAVFTAVTVPYVVLLTLFGLPFNHNLFWLYVLPPGLLTWLATRPVLESKRLPELLMSQMRYLGEPSTWCRMAPLAEKDQVVVVGRVWRRADVTATAEAVQAEIAAEQDQAAGELPVTARPALPVATPVVRPAAAQAATAATVPARRAWGGQARGRLVRQSQVPEQLAPEEAPAGLPRDERTRQAAKPRESRWARAAGTSRQTPAPGRPGTPDPVRAPDSVKGPGSAMRPDSAIGPGQTGEAQGTPVAGVGWARGMRAGTWREPGLAGSAGHGRHAAPAKPPAPPAPVGYATGGAQPMAPGTSGPVDGGPVNRPGRWRPGHRPRRPALPGLGDRRRRGHRLADDRLRHGCERRAWRPGCGCPAWRPGCGCPAWRPGCGCPARRPGCGCAAWRTGRGCASWPELRSRPGSRPGHRRRRTQRRRHRLAGRLPDRREHAARRASRARRPGAQRRRGCWPRCGPGPWRGA